MVDKNRITAEHSLDANYLKYSCMINEPLDEVSIRVIKNDMPEFLLPIRMMKMNNSVEFRYLIGSQTSLKYKDLIFNKVQFLRMYKSLLYPFIEGNDWMIDYHYYCIDTNYVFLEKNGRDVKYMYIPVDSCRNSDEEILEFIKEIVNCVTVEDDSSFLLKLYQRFNRGNVTLKELYHMVEVELNNEQESKVVSQSVASVPKKPKPELVERQVKSVEVRPKDDSMQKVTTVAKENDKPFDKKGGLFSGWTSKKEKETNLVEPDSVSPISFGESGDQDAVINALFGKTDKTSKKKEKIEHKSKEKEKTGGLFGNKKKAVVMGDIFPTNNQSVSVDKVDTSVTPAFQQPRENVVPNYEYTQIDQGGDVTQIEGMYVESPSQYLISMNEGMSGIPERIELNFSKERITIGRQSSDMRQPEVVFSSDIKRIGRMHACIQRENEEYYLVDLGSANGTSLNGEVLVPNQPYRLRNNDIIGFVVAQPIKYRVVL